MLTTTAPFLQVGSNLIRIESIQCIRRGAGNPETHNPTTIQVFCYGGDHNNNHDRICVQVHPRYFDDVWRYCRESIQGFNATDHPTWNPEWEAVDAADETPALATKVCFWNPLMKKWVNGTVKTADLNQIEPVVDISTEEKTTPAHIRVGNQVRYWNVCKNVPAIVKEINLNRQCAFLEFPKNDEPSGWFSFSNIAAEAPPPAHIRVGNQVQYLDFSLKYVPATIKEVNLIDRSAYLEFRNDPPGWFLFSNIFPAESSHPDHIRVDNQVRCPSGSPKPSRPGKGVSQ